jgi:hypothetical protein
MSTDSGVTLVLSYANSAERVLHWAVYATFLAGLAAVTVYAVRRLTNGILAGSMICLAVGILSGTKIACRDPDYPCGDMLYASHLPAETVVAVVAAFAAWLVAAIGFRVPAGRLALAVRPLAGLWLVVIWKNLPRPFIHVPRFGGGCPDLPLLCHDVPLFGYGELLWMSLPFLAWAAWTGLLAVRRSGKDAIPR